MLVNLLQPGKDLGLPLPDIGAATNLETASFTLKDFVTHLVPRSFVEAMANNEILQIVVFSMFFGVALAALGDNGKTLIAVDRRSSAHVMLKITGYVMLLAPLAVFAAMAATVATQRPRDPGDVRRVHGRLLPRPRHPVGPAGRWPASCSSAGACSSCSVSSGSPSCCRSPPRAPRPPIRRSSMRSTASACKRKISSFVLPLGYSFNLDGSMMYCTFATMFIAQAYDIDLPIAHADHDAADADADVERAWPACRARRWW